MATRFSLFAFVVLFAFVACSGETQTLSLEDQVAALTAEHQYEDAIRLLKSADTNEPAVRSLLTKTYLDYGIYVEYEDNSREMRDKMTTALRQYIEVLKLEPQHEKATAEIDQIVGIYQTMPGRTLPADILDELRGLGLDGGIQADSTGT